MKRSDVTAEFLRAFCAVLVGLLAITGFGWMLTQLDGQALTWSRVLFSWAALLLVFLIRGLVVLKCEGDGNDYE